MIWSLLSKLMGKFTIIFYLERKRVYDKEKRKRKKGANWMKMKGR